MNFPAIYALVVGVGMIIQWTLSYLGEEIPELKTEPVRIWFHIAAEMITAFSLLISGIALLTSASWGINLFLISMGMLFYTSIVSPGYFAQQGKWGWLVMFSAILILGLASILVIL